MKRAVQSVLIRRLMGWAAVVLLGGSASAEPPRRDQLGDPLPPGAMMRLGTTRLRHDGPVHIVAFAPDGKTLASGGEDGAIRIWETATGRELHCLRGSYEKVFTLAYSPDGKILAAGGDAGDIDLWDPATGAKWDQFGGGASIVSFAFAPDSKTLAAGTRAGGVVWRDVATGDRLHSLKGSHASVDSLAYSPDGKMLAYACGNGEFGLCDPVTGKEVRKLRKGAEHPASYPPSVAFSPDGKKLLVTDKDCWLLLDAVSGKGLRGEADPPFHGRPAYAPNGRLVATMSWALRGRPLPVTCLDFAPDDRTLVSGSADGTLRFWDVTAGKELRVLRGSEGIIKAVAFSPDGKIIASGDSLNVVRLWHAATGKELWRFEGPRKNAFDQDVGMRLVAFSPNGRTLIAGGGEGTVYLWDAATHKPRRRFEGTAMVVSPDGKLLAGGGDDAVRVWDAATGRKVVELGAEGLASVAFAPDGKLLARRRSYSQIYFWELANGKEMFHIDTIEGIAGFSPDGRYLITTDGMLWDMGTGKEAGQLDSCEERIAAFAISRDGRILARGGADGTILVQSLPRPERRKSLLSHEPSARELRTLWTDLAGSDPPRAWRAMRTLIESPQGSVPFLQTMLRPCPPLDRRRLDRLLVDLDSEQFTVREQARKELTHFGELAEPALRRILEGKPSLEVRRRVLALLEHIEKEGRAPESLRALRVTTVLERLDTPESVELLRRLAGGAAEARLTREAAAALTRRIGRRASPSFPGAR